MKKSKARGSALMTEWSQTDWRKLERYVFKLQKRIYRASQRGDYRAMHRLQKTLIQSWSAKCLAVRRVAQENLGKKTAGVDGIKNLSNTQRSSLAANLKLSLKASPLRPVAIAKVGSRTEQRILKIPTMADRALQVLVKQALEPEWEAKFEPNSFGFRPGRSCHDAIEAIYTSIKQKAKFALETDIFRCFDQINHSALLSKLQTFPRLRRQLKAWLKAGVLEGFELKPSTEGAAQGGPISPLIANIALHGMETWIKSAFPQRNAPHLVRYADDLVILHTDISVIEQCQQMLTDWLKDMGLELKPSKTRIVHTLKPYEQQPPGFDFLGFTVRQFPVGKNQTGKSSNGTPLGFKTLIKPSREALKAHTRKVGQVIDTHRGVPQAALIEHLNPVIIGWSNYYSTVVSRELFARCDHILYQQLRRWGNRRHPRKSQTWVNQKYWKTIDSKLWVFSTSGQRAIRMRQHSETAIVRHVKVQKNRSPYDGDFVYWSTRMQRYPLRSQRVARLLRRQKGRCSQCGMYFRDGDLMEIDHSIPTSQGGRDEHQNLQLLHRHCHDIKTAKDGRR
jgi:RNA-directed DNA polymerase